MPQAAIGFNTASGSTHHLGWYHLHSDIMIMHIQVGLAIRSAVKGHLPEPSFAGVTLAFTFITLVGWRSALAALTPDQVTATILHSSLSGYSFRWRKKG